MITDNYLKLWQNLNLADKILIVTNLTVNIQLIFHRPTAIFIWKDEFFFFKTINKVRKFSADEIYLQRFTISWYKEFTIKPYHKL